MMTSSYDPLTREGETMKTKTMIALTLAGLIGGMGPRAAGAEGPAGRGAEQLGMLEVRVQVDGLSCPFCAYGLEKKLRRVDNVAALEIQVNAGRAVVTPAPGTSVDLAALEQAVRDGGFTPRGLHVAAQGRLTELNGAPALELPDGVLLLLAENAKATELLRSQDQKVAEETGPVVRVQGQAARQRPEGHADHPYTLTIRTFEVW